jgi:hypothetical protein
MPEKTPEWPSEKARAVYQALKEMTDDERGSVLCWFCKDCFRYVGPGDFCRCSE